MEIEQMLIQRNLSSCFNGQKVQKEFNRQKYFVPSKDFMN